MKRTLSDSGVLYHLYLDQYFHYVNIRYLPFPDQFEVFFLDGTKTRFNFEDVSQPLKTYDSSGWTGR